MSDASTAAPVAPTRSARRKARTRAAIIDAAEQIVRRDGFERASIDEISALADVGVGSIYHHFGSKDGLLLALIEQAVISNQEYLNAGFAADGTPLQRLAAVQVAYLRFYREQPFWFDLIILEYERRAASYAPAAVARIGEIAQDTLERSAALIQEGQDAGELRAVEPLHIARFLWAALNGLLASSRRPDALALPPDQVDAVLASGMQIVLEGFATRRGLNRLRG